MKKNRLLALLLVSVMAAGMVTSCDNPVKDTAVSSETSAAVQTEPSAVPTTVTNELSGYKELPVAEVADEDDGKILIYSYNREFAALAEKYAGITDNDYEFVEISDVDEYQEKLDAVLANGNGAPDIFVCDAAFAKKYITSGKAIAINDLGIDYSECADMFDYTLRFASDDDGVIRGLAWKACPCGVFYERTLAEKYLGTSDPDELAASFASWDSVLGTAGKVNTDSEGSVKLIPGYTEIYDAFLASRSTGWLKDGEINIDPDAEGLFDYAKTLYTDDLTFNAEKWSDSWNSRMSNRTVVSYWGSLQFAKYQLALNPGEGSAVNPTAGDWGITSAPENYFSGGAWVMVSSYSGKKATAAEIIRAVCINEDNLKDMVNKGEFANSIRLMTEASEDDKFAFMWLGGQNPYSVLLNSALNADASLYIVDEDKYRRAYSAVVGAYSEGAFETADEAKEAFAEEFTEAEELDEEEQEDDEEQD
ncbi:MAG: extracellular solute-binding protein [Saccharofermentans sp.]|nr:extracellular solute-binding protein [Saccharofermentans sp.]